MPPPAPPPLIDEVDQELTKKREEDQAKAKARTPQGRPGAPPGESVRRLAAIMFTDMAGYTSLAQQDEAGALALLKEQEEIVRPLFAAHQGREIKSTGDGSLVEFDSALHAVQCAVAIHQKLHDRNGKRGVKPIHLRIGVHLGDVEERGADIFGDAVNVASRIEPLASPEGICVSRPVFDQVRNKVANRFEPFGPTTLKHVDVPMDVYRLLLPWETPSKFAAPPAPSVGAAPPGVTRPAPTAPATRPLPPEVAAFLSVDGEERFNIEKLNSFDYERLRYLVSHDAALAQFVLQRIDPVIARVHQETTTSTATVVVLSQRVAEWYRTSADRPEWSSTTPRRWGGIFAPSTTKGGEKRVWLQDRLVALKVAAGGKDVSGSSLRKFLPGGMPASEPARSPASILMGRVAQAILDDLAATPRNPNRNIPLPRLSELALEGDVQDVSDLLADLFPSPRGAYILVHPNRFPDCGIIGIQPPDAKAQGAALSFLLVSSAPPAAGGSAAGLAPPSLGGDSGEGPSVWDPPGLKAPEWETRLADLRDHGQRLPAPPVSTYRQLGSYQELRSLLGSSESARRAFQNVKWKNKPKGPLLLLQLLQDRSFTPTTDTDVDYLEAELNDAMSGDTDKAPPDGVWTTLGWKVTRVPTPQGPAYKAETAGGGAPAPLPAAPAVSALAPPSPALAAPSVLPAPSIAAVAAHPAAPAWPLEEPLCYVETSREEDLWGRIGAADLLASEVLGFTKQSPDAVRKTFGLDGATLYRISTVEGADLIHPSDLERIGLFIDRHMSSGPRRAVVLPGIENLVEASSPKNVRRLLDVVRDIAHPSQGSMLFSLDQNSLPKEQVALLERSSFRLEPGAFVRKPVRAPPPTPEAPRPDPAPPPVPAAAPPVATIGASQTLPDPTVDPKSAPLPSFAPEPPSGEKLVGFPSPETLPAATTIPPGTAASPPVVERGVPASASVPARVPLVPGAKVATGTPRLDVLLNGGFPTGGQLALVGPAFVGKEVAILSFLAGTLARGASVLVLATNRAPSDIAHDLGARLPSYADLEAAGKVRWIDACLPEVSPVTPAPASLAARLPGPGDLAAILKSVAKEGEALAQSSQGFTFVMFSLSTTLIQAEERSGANFVQNLTSILRRRAQASLFMVDSAMHSQQQVEAILSMMDGALLFRSDRGKNYLQVVGLAEAVTRQSVEYKFTPQEIQLGSYSLERIR